MSYVIKYSLCCNKGKLRKKNQDNFYCNGYFLPSENEGLDGSISGKIRVKANRNISFAVFDGMGGEQQGEMAAHIAASSYADWAESDETAECTTFGMISCMINRKICEYAVRNSVSSMGTTGCFIGFDPCNISYLNIGDSKIFQLTDGCLLQRSKDHCLKIGNGKAPLTQFFGIPENEFIIQPHISCEEYKNNDRWLICSDGLTDMVGADAIAKILKEEKDTDKCCRLLTETALENGGRDNVTVLICDIKKKLL